MGFILLSSTLVFAAVFLACQSGAARVGRRHAALCRRSDAQARFPIARSDGALELPADLGHVARGGVRDRRRSCFAMPPVAIAAVYLVYVAPRIILDLMIRRRRALLRDQMVTATIALANTSRAGLSLAQGLETVGKETPGAARLRNSPGSPRVQARPTAGRSPPGRERPAQHR